MKVKLLNGVEIESYTNSDYPNFPPLIDICDPIYDGQACGICPLSMACVNGAEWECISMGMFNGFHCSYVNKFIIEVFAECD